MAIQIISTGRIVLSVFGPIMLPAVQLNRQFYLRTVKIQNIGAETVLTEELHTKELLVSDFYPESPFGISLVSA